MRNDNTLQTVIAAKVAAELFHAQQITRSLSISSKNLRVLAKRIGESAAGLAVLASFYDECSRESITLADHVSAMTVQTASNAVKEWRYSLFEEKLEKACTRMPPQRVPAIVLEVLAAKPQRELQSKERISHFNRELNDLLISMQKNIRSIAVIAVNSKIEAPRTGVHSPVLLDMAQNVEDMIKLILKHIDTALKFLAKNQQFI
jgi:TolB-like protein